MNLIPLHFIGFIDEGVENKRYIDTVLYEKAFINADKIVGIKPYCYHEELPVPVMYKADVNEASMQGSWVCESVVDNFIDFTDKVKECTVVFFDNDYAYLLSNAVLNYDVYNPQRLVPSMEGVISFVIYESIAEIQALMRGDKIKLATQ